MSIPLHAKIKAVVRTGLAPGMGFCLLTMPTALAQQSTNQPVELAPSVITGTRLTAAEAEGALSVTTVDTSKPENQGFPRITDVLRQKLPQYGGGGFVNEAFGNGGDGSSGIALRGLPSGATLVLVNGRRVSTSDLNLIPDAAVERVEILNDGAGAIYGSDAVAGVVNIILKRDFNGTRIRTYYANTTDTDVSNRKFEALIGGSTENSRFVASAEYSAANDQLARDREVSGILVASTQTSNPGRFQEIVTPTTHTVARPDGSTINVADFLPLRWALNWPVVRGVTSSNQVPAGFDPLARADTRTAQSTAEANAMRDAEEAARNAALGPNSPFVYGFHPGLVPGFPAGFFPFGLWTTAYREHEKYGTSLFAEHELFGDNLKGFLDAYYVRNRSSFFLAPSPLANRPVTGGNFWVQQVFPGVAPASRWNFSYRPVEIGPRHYKEDWESFHGVAGLKGQIAETSWNWEVAFLWDRVERDQDQLGGVQSSVYNASLSSANPATAFNPFGFTDPAGGANSVNSAAITDQFTASAFEKLLATTMGVDANVRGEVFDLPGGAIQISAGGETRREKLDYRPDFAIQQGLIFPFNILQPLQAQRDINSLFGEARIPVFGPDFSIPAFHAFDIEVAARYEDFSDVGDTGVKPRVAFRWQPIGNQLTIRGSYAQGFIAPGFFDLYQEPGQDFTEVLNPFTGIRQQPRDAVLTIGNPNLKPEEAETWSIGAVYSPDYIKGMTLSATYYRIEQSGIPFSSADYVLAQWFAAGPDNANNPFGPNAGPSAANPTAAQVEYNPLDLDIIQVRNLGPINTGIRQTDGIDFGLLQEVETGIGTFTFDGKATRMMTFEQEDFPGAGIIDYLGQFWPPGAALSEVGFPEWRATAALSWELDRVNATIAWNYMDGYLENQDGRTVESYQTFDARVGYKIPWIEAYLLVGVNNFLDEAPPVVVSSFENQFDRRNTDIRGRMYFVSLEKTF
jgi:iron complex outermembrane recepter protein